MTERPQDGARPGEPDRVVFRDKRKIDPVTGEARKPAASPGDSGPDPAAAAPHPSAESAEVAALQEALAERTSDLQRVQAEYANYRKRAERDRLAAGDLAIGRVLVELLPVLDDIDRARVHDDLTGALKSVADHLEGIFAKLGVEAFGEVGDRFDPAVHEAVLHAESDEVNVPTSTSVMRRGYRHGERLLRPAMVGVSEPASVAVQSPPTDVVLVDLGIEDGAERDAEDESES